MSYNMMFLDFSMLGYHPEDCIILDCSVAVASKEKMLSGNPYTTMEAFKEVKRFKLGIPSQKTLGFVAHESGIDFWKSQSREMVDRVLKPSDKDLSVIDFATSFIDHLIPKGKIDTWWSWNSMDDAAILWRLFRSVNKEATIREYLPRHKARDVATFIDGKLGLENTRLDFVPIIGVDYWNKIYIKADSSMEVMANIMRVQAVLRAELDLELPEK
jgi:hypothetical protein